MTLGYFSLPWAIYTILRVFPHIWTVLSLIWAIFLFIMPFNLSRALPIILGAFLSFFGPFHSLYYFSLFLNLFLPFLSSAPPHTNLRLQLINTEVINVHLDKSFTRLP